MTEDNGLIENAANPPGAGGGGPVTGNGGKGGGDPFAAREHAFNSSLGDVMGNWMAALTKAEVDRQIAWAAQLVRLFTPDAQGNVPTVDMTSKLDFSDGKDPAQASSVGIKFPVGLAIMGEQFAPDTASLTMDMNVSSSTLDTSSLSGKVEGSGEAKVGWGPISATVKISASMSTSSDKKRQSDYRSTTHAELQMKRVPTPEPVQVALNAWTDLVHVQGEIAKAKILASAQQTAESDKLIPANPTP